MTDLHPTPTRVELAKSIAAGDVLEDWYTGQRGEINQRSMGRQWKVTGKVDLMRSAGLCETSPDDEFEVRTTALTDAGREWLAQHNGGN